MAKICPADFEAFLGEPEKVMKTEEVRLIQCP